MSGTSADGIDSVLVRFGDQVEIIGSLFCPYSDDMRQKLLQLNEPSHQSPARICHLHKALGVEFASAVQSLLQHMRMDSRDIRAIGCHGHTVLHAPLANQPFSLQIGCGATIATLTRIPTVCDFRNSDIAAGGQGAPLVPAFHQRWFKLQNQNTAVLNIGGIANLTLFSQNGTQIVAFDTGPGNALMDEWCYKHTGYRFDRDGQWARSGRVNTDLLDSLLSDAYFDLPTPKSTGRDLFNLALVEQCLNQIKIDIGRADIQATLCEFTVVSVAQALKRHEQDFEVLYVCGGGVHNVYLMERLAEASGCPSVTTTAEVGIHPDWVEATAFAWFAQSRMSHAPLDLTAITGAGEPSMLGAIYAPPSSM